MKYYSVLITKIVQHEVLLVANDEFEAKAKAVCDPFDKVKNKEGVYSVKESDVSTDVQVEEIDQRLFNTKVYDPSEICQTCGEPFWSYDGCVICT